MGLLISQDVVGDAPFFFEGCLELADRGRDILKYSQIPQTVGYNSVDWNKCGP